MPRYADVALVVNPIHEEKVRVVNAIAEYNRLHDQWNIYVDDQARAVKSPQWLLERKWSGLICLEDAPDLIRAAAEQGIPQVDLSDTDLRIPGVPKIRPDNVAIGQVAGEYFADRGYRYFAFCGFEDLHWTRERLAGFREAIAHLGVDPFVFQAPRPSVKEPGWHEEYSRDVLTWVRKLPRPVAILGANDYRAVAASNACRKLDRNVPDDVAILGVNNQTLRCELTHPELSSIPVDCEYWGKRAAQVLSDLLRGSAPERDLLLIDPLEVVSRRSTEATAVPDAHVARAVSMIRDNACHGVTVDDLVREVGVSRSVLERRFRKFLGRSPQVEIRRFQVNRIKQLLAATDYTLAEIAGLTGFEHPEYMSVVFKRITAHTPSEFRHRHRLSA